MDSNIFLVNQVVQDIRDYYEHQNNALKITWKDKICKHFKKQAKLKSIQFTYEVIDIPEKIFVDEKKTQSVIVNLLSNAFKFTHKNGNVKIEASYKKEEDLIKISVKDSGIGMNFGEQQRLKQLLSGKTLQNKISQNSSGFGFGLTISNILTKKMINRNQYNSIQFTSKQSKGSTFWFYLDATSMIKRINYLSLANQATQNRIPSSLFYQNSEINSNFQKFSEEQDKQKTLILQNETPSKSKDNIQKISGQQSQLNTESDNNQIEYPYQISDETQQLQIPENKLFNGQINQTTNFNQKQQSQVQQQIGGQLSQLIQNPMNSNLQQSKQHYLSQFKANSNLLSNQIQQSNISGPKILQKYIILSDQEIIEIQESDFQDYSDIYSKIFQKEIAQSQLIEVRALQSEWSKQNDGSKTQELSKQIDISKSKKLKKNSFDSFLLISDANQNQSNVDHTSKISKNIDQKINASPLKITPRQSITQSFQITSQGKDKIKKQKEDQSLVDQSQLVPLQPQPILLTKISNQKIQDKLIDSGEDNSSEVPPLEFIQVNLPNQVQNKFFSANKIMIVDDEPMNIKGLQILLKIKANIQDQFILTATNGIEAIEQYQKSIKQLNSIKLIFMDINMPLMDGIGATKSIREIEQQYNLKKTNICAYTSWTDLQTKIKCNQSGMDNYFSKPISHEQLIVALNRYYFSQSVL